MYGAKEGLEQSRKIVLYAIHSIQLMHDHYAASEANTTEILCLSIDEQSPVLVSCDSFLQSIRLENLLHGLLGFFLTHGASENLQGLLGAVLLGQPTRRLGKAKDEYTGYKQENKLESHRKCECFSTCASIESVVDPLC